jgi:4-alpha-glucanotransferase
VSEQALRALAVAHDVVPHYDDVDGRRHDASVETLVGVLSALGVPVRGPVDAPALLEERVHSPRPLLEPVVVGWTGVPVTVAVTLPDDATQPDHVDVEVAAEDGGVRHDRVALRTGGVVELPLGLPPGYHELHVEAGAHTGDALLVVAPRRAPAPPGPRAWGVFAPLYALWRADGSGAHLGLLDAAGDWAARFGGAYVATLPVLASFLDQPFDPSPYRPASRRHWNEVYVDCARLPELAGDGAIVVPAAEDRTVDLRALMAAKWPLLERGAAALDAAGGRRRKALDRFVEAQPDVVEYARFRAAVEERGADRAAWPSTWGRAVPPTGVDPGRVATWVYAQFAAEEQMAEVAGALAARGQALALDLPVGNHPDGFDVFRDPTGFARAASVGAPPDGFFADGQDWGFPPPHPSGMRATGYADVRSTLAHHLRHAGLLRIDHVMGLHRLWWIPAGAAARDGAYVEYRSDELFAIVCLEAQRHAAVLQGEDLGTVPPAVTRALGEHGLLHTFVAQFDLDPARTPVVRPAPPDAVASIDTHDTATFAGFWTGEELEERRRQGGVCELDARREAHGRAELRAALVRDLVARGLLPAEVGPDDLSAAALAAVLSAVLAELGAGPAAIVTVALDDLLLEPRQQNLPGTTAAQRANFRRRLAASLDALEDAPSVTATLERLARARRQEVAR